MSVNDNLAQLKYLNLQQWSEAHHGLGGVIPCHDPGGAARARPEAGDKGIRRGGSSQHETRRSSNLPPVTRSCVGNGQNNRLVCLMYMRMGRPVIPSTGGAGKLV